MKVLIIASDKGELKGLSDEYIKVVSGVGPVMAAVAASREIERVKPDCVISLGSAGAISRHLKAGEAYSFAKVVCPDQNLTTMHLPLGVTIDKKRSTVGELETADRASRLILSTSGAFSSEITDAHKTLYADASDMEAYGVALAARESGIPFFAIKLITDYVGDKSTIGDISFNLREGRAKLSSLLEEVLSYLQY